ncbi:hypothetical protein TrispH2_006794 [Trichoplax sp. H2]|nr:hypothetical protein TrispH2_006794 [Trichoplax sp. H2]|eukprot:RDD42268.1 hypothetical protein TrispH2_006794 [Trichoplax sp. H2]
MSDQETYCNSVTASPRKRECKKFYTSVEDLMLLQTAVIISPFTRNYGTIMKSWAKVSRIMQDQGMPSSATRCRDRVKLLLSYLAHNNIEKIAASDETSEETDEKLRLLRQLELSRQKCDSINLPGSSNQSGSAVIFSASQSSTGRSDRYHRSSIMASNNNNNGRVRHKKRSRDEILEENNESNDHDESNDENGLDGVGGDDSQISKRWKHPNLSSSPTDDLRQLIHLLKNTTEKYYHYQSRLLDIEGKELDVDIANLEAERRRLELATKERRTRQLDRIKRLDMDREERIKLIQFIEEKL